MAVQYRKLTETELEAFIEIRIRQLREEGAAQELDLKPALRDYYNRHMADGTFVSWLAADGERIVGTSGMSFVERPPHFGCPNGKMGLLSSMFTARDYRRQGIAKRAAFKGGKRGQGLSDAVMSRSRPPIWGFCCIRISVL